MCKRARFAFEQEVKMVTVILVSSGMATCIDDNGCVFETLDAFLKFKEQK